VDQTAQAAGGASLDGAREQFLGLLLRRFESGAFDAYEYSQRVRALELAATVEAMADIVEAPVVTESSLDAVDMLLLANATPARARGERKKPYVWLVVVGIFFVVLLMVGMWLVSHAKALQNSGNLGMSSLAGTLGQAPPSAPPSARSSRR
jgi:hypothetical protein